MVLSISHISPIRAVPVLRLPDFSTFLWLGVVTARSADRPVLTRGAASYPPGLAALPCVLTSLRGLRLARSPLRYRLASPTPRSEPRLLSARTHRGSAPPRLPLADSLCRRRPPLLLPDGLPPLPPTTSIASSLCPALYPSLSDGLAPSEPRSVRADVIPGSERHAAHRRASAGRGSAPRRPGERRGVPQSAELRSLRDQPPAPAQATRSHIAPPASAAPLARAAIPPPLSPSSLFGRLGVVVDHRPL